ncbi:MAG: TetR family transcriptional regulator [Henriciella sp.]|nr:TetR family transcriptional regulator [Henriciella sp.]
MNDESGPTETEADEAHVDGRRERSERSRRKIIDAMFELINSGEMHPGAAGIAKAAGVSLRTVFRHFEEMDSLFREMNTRLEEEILPLAMTPFSGDDWRAQIDEMIDRRREIYRRIFHLKVSASVRRFQSRFIQEAERAFVQLERQRLASILPSEIQEDAALFAALQLATGFAAWHQLVVDQGLSWDEAADTIRLTVGRVLKDG